mmetsp:Transcript_51171/g.132860  ORF Transcript_51171/g.132860 Transcript_51171/m.132860 type:complete len:296 (+) Transcript_51171:93-980(+)
MKVNERRRSLSTAQPRACDGYILVTYSGWECSSRSRCAASIVSTSSAEDAAECTASDELFRRRTRGCVAPVLARCAAPSASKARFLRARAAASCVASCRRGKSLINAAAAPAFRTAPRPTGWRATDPRRPAAASRACASPRESTATIGRSFEVSASSPRTAPCIASARSAAHAGSCTDRSLPSPRQRRSIATARAFIIAGRCASTVASAPRVYAAAEAISGLREPSRAMSSGSDPRRTRSSAVLRCIASDRAARTAAFSSGVLAPSAAAAAAAAAESCCTEFGRSATVSPESKRT